jgi:hypothetical protein
MKTSLHFAQRIVLVLYFFVAIATVSACGSTPVAAQPPVLTNTAAPTVTIPAVTDTAQVCTYGQLCSPGEDWKHECISSRWIVYPLLDIPIDDQSCYQQPIWKHVFTNDGRLMILAQHKSIISAETYGIFTQIPQSSKVRMTIDLDLIENGDVWVGVFSTTDVNSEGVVLIAPPGKVEEHAFAIKSLPIGETIELTPKYANASGQYSIGFDVYNGAISAVVENTQRKAVGFSSNQRWLFIGYRAGLEQGAGTANVTAIFSNLIITSE